MAILWDGYLYKFFQAWRRSGFKVAIWKSLRKLRIGGDISYLASLGVKSGGRFEKLLKDRYNVDSFEKITGPVLRNWLDFATSTVLRGEAVVQMLTAHTEIKEKRCLDVGCAYGGFLLAFERAGASDVVGIDVSTSLLNYSEALKEDHQAKFRIYRKDILDRECLGDLGTFDVITCNDVIEHVSCAETALLNMVSILNPGGLIYLEIPNRFSASFVKKDGHFGMFGITLLPKREADRYFDVSFSHDGTNDVYYRGLNYYLSILRRLGVSYEILDPRGPGLEMTKMTFGECRELTKTFAIKDHRDLSDSINRRVNKIAGLFDRQHEHYLTLLPSAPEMAEKLRRRLLFTFAEDFWCILVKKPGSKEVD
jgi:2-polyprenyl-3-methyl-5-hydroxy-6-metoxy-1,4-benzoquinol methylase